MTSATRFSAWLGATLRKISATTDARAAIRCMLRPHKMPHKIEYIIYPATLLKPTKECVACSFSQFASAAQRMKNSAGLRRESFRPHTRMDHLTQDVKEKGAGG